MRNNSPLFFEYTEIRRRVEQKRREEDATFHLSDDGALVEAYQADMSKAERTD